MLKTCLQCGKQFELTVYNKKFCSPLCKYNYAYKKFKDKKLKNRRTEQKKIKTKKMKSKTCFSCGKPFQPSFRGEKFCSDVCRLNSFSLDVNLGRSL